MKNEEWRKKEESAPRAQLSIYLIKKTAFWKAFWKIKISYSCTKTEVLKIKNQLKFCANQRKFKSKAEKSWNPMPSYGKI